MAKLVAKLEKEWVMWKMHCPDEIVESGLYLGEKIKKPSQIRRKDLPGSYTVGPDGIVRVEGSVQPSDFDKRYSRR